MRTVEDLKNISEWYDFQNSHKFDDLDARVQEVRNIVDLCEVMRDGRTADTHVGNCFSNAPGGSAVKANDGGTPATNREAVKYQNSYVGGGYDGGIEVGIYGAWRDKPFTSLCSALDKCKAAADRGDYEASLIELGGIVFVVRPSGASVAGVRFKYVIEAPGVKVYIHSRAVGSIAPVRVRYGFDALCRSDLFSLHDAFLQVLSREGFAYETEILSRVDMQILTTASVFDFVEAMQGGRVVTQCRGKMQLHTNLSTMAFETIFIASKTCELCIYDKVAQLNDADAVTYSLFCDCVLGGESLPETLTRVELRLRRESLKRYSINSLSDLKDCQAALPQVFLTEWFRILAEEKVRGSEREQALHPLWEHVLDCFSRAFSIDEDGSKADVRIVKSRKPEKLPHVDRLVKVAKGVMSSICSLCLSLPDFEDVNAFLQNLVKVSNIEVTQKVQQKQKELFLERGFSPENPQLYENFVFIQSLLFCARAGNYQKI